MTQPVLFIGHGSPMNIVNQNDFTRAITDFGQKLIKPKAILIISAHWLTRGTTVTFTDSKLETIYDFGGFSDELYQVRYNPSGSTELATQIQEILKPTPVVLDSNRGLDHGAWSVLHRLFPEANIPVVQLSIDFTKSAQENFEIAQRLSQLREQGVLIIASGNLVHTFDDIDFDENAKEKAWALEFQNDFKKRLLTQDFADLINYKNLKDWDKAINRADHYFPLLYALGASKENDKLEIIFEGIQNATMSMLSFCFE
jgi:4,5-DOPA dioxygenase extradiol